MHHRESHYQRSEASYKGNGRATLGNPSLPSVPELGPWPPVTCAQKTSASSETSPAVEGMLFVQRCLLAWRQIRGAGRDVNLALRHLSSQTLPPVNTEESLEQIRSRIFGTHIGNGIRSGRKVLRKRLVGDKVASYYPEPVAKYDPMFVDMDMER